ncbi:MAG: ABC transporter ATP-binding protein [Candidatus Eisenbacteria bacterium]|uniref:ABC transporter ATP-binding protein n=1 Tax=Eiseniibacteriota bacterium TaxID=2212470 RepID=A0A7Y2ECB8_UNCEI|nr:ABC transporter ATP-binding protein [Candidatus Eisenbacteria bacterium]
MTSGDNTSKKISEPNPSVDAVSAKTEFFAAADDPEQIVTVSWSRVWALLGPLFRTQWAHFTGAALLLLFSTGLMVVGPLLVKRAIDTDIANRDVEGLQQTVLLYLGTQLLYLIVFYLMRIWLEYAGQRMMATLKQRLFRHIMKLPLAFFDRNAPGKLLSRVENDTEALRMLFTTTTVMLIGDAVLFVGMFAAMFFVSPRLAGVTALVIPVLLISTWYFQGRTRPLFIAYRGLTAEICGRLAEFIQGLPILQAFSRRDWAADHFQSVNIRRFRVAYEGERLWLFWFNFVIFMEFFAFALILGFGGVWALKGIVTIGTLAMFMGYVRRFFEPIMRLSDQMVVVQKAMAGGERVLNLLQEEVTIKDKEQAESFPALKEGIEFRGVWFRYREDLEWVLQDVSFFLPAGNRHALVGPTGSGKSTIISLLLRFYDPTRGQILVDGRDLREFSQREVRARVGLVMQDLYLFPGDLHSNLTLGRERSDQEVQRAIEMTEAQGLVKRLPNGLKEVITERGKNLSMGERQLLSFTRAVVGDPDLLILDEATSAVDPSTEARIQHSLERILEKRTALIVAHRLSTVRSCDEILVLSQGKIAERGTHSQLLEQGGLYRALYELQFKEVSHAS